MREIVTLHFGQAGVQLGNATWELLCLEHGINEIGHLHNEHRDIENIETFFSISQSGNFVPRSLYIDLEPTVIDEVRKGSNRHLFHPDRLISGPEDASNNFARGFFTVGKLILSTINKELKKVMESCDNCHGLMIFRSLGGGTGSGLTSALLDDLVDYSKTYKLEMPIYPSPTLSSSNVEPYNSLLAQHFCMEEIDIGLLFDNESAYDICAGNLKNRSASFSIINRLIAQICSNLTVSIRFENTISSDLTVLQTNLVPYPRIHFPLCSYSPMIPQSYSEYVDITVSELTKSVFEPDTQLMKVDQSFGRIMSCSLNYRGDICPYHVYMTLLEIKGNKQIEFVDWCPTGFRVGINLNPPVISPDSGLVSTKRNVTLLTNTTAIGQAWQRLTHRFYMLYSKRSFVHWFVGEGMEECEFTESLYNISSLVKDYEECVLDTNYEDTSRVGHSEPTNQKESLESQSKRKSSDVSVKEETYYMNYENENEMGEDFQEEDCIDEADLIDKSSEKEDETVKEDETIKEENYIKEEEEVENTDEILEVGSVKEGEEMIKDEETSKEQEEIKEDEVIINEEDLKEEEEIRQAELKDKIDSMEDYNDNHDISNEIDNIKEEEYNKGNENHSKSNEKIEVIEEIQVDREGNEFNREIIIDNIDEDFT